MQKTAKIAFFYVFLPLAALSASVLAWFGEGLISHHIENTVLFSCIFLLLLAHFTITSMSLSFHRLHTHGGITMNRVVDLSMQTLLWLVTSMNKADWVAIHKVHHKHSDTASDVHGPIAKGFWHSLLLGWVDYNQGRKNPEVISEREKISLNSLERFYFKNPLAGPFVMSSLMIFLFGIELGLVYSLANILISPLLGVGGVNTLAHWWGYKNHRSNDNSRNLGFLVPLNVLICGELDHNNHHGRQKSCSFRHKWYEFDIGYFYILSLQWLGLAEVKFAFTTRSMKEELSLKWQKTLEKHEHLMQRCHELAEEFKISRQQLVQRISDNIAGKKLKLEKPFIAFKHEVLKAMKAQYEFVRNG